MFLNLLNNEEKEIFLKLAIAIVQADKKIEEKEKSFIAEYSREMEISEYDLHEKIDFSLLVAKIAKNSTDAAKRIFLLELAACAYADGDFAEEEKVLMKSFTNKLGLSEKCIEHCSQLLTEYSQITTKLSNFVQEKM